MKLTHWNNREQNTVTYQCCFRKCKYLSISEWKEINVMIRVGKFLKKGLSGQVYRWVITVINNTNRVSTKCRALFHWSDVQRKNSKTAILMTTEFRILRYRILYMLSQNLTLGRPYVYISPNSGFPSPRCLFHPFLCPQYSLKCSFPPAFSWWSCFLFRWENRNPQ